VEWAKRTKNSRQHRTEDYIKSRKASRRLLQETSKLLDELGRLYIYKYRDIYGKLVEKSKRMKWGKTAERKFRED
jgi:hypothetical protein